MAVGKAVGLSEAAVRQRVQRLTFVYLELRKQLYDWGTR
jgi:hypothetical protein